MTWDWKSLIKNVLPVILSWLLGSLGVGPAPLTPNRLMNTPTITK